MKAYLDFFEILSQSNQEIPFSISVVLDLQSALEYCFLLSFGGQVVRGSLAATHSGAHICVTFYYFP